jgi:hypothetical protein
MLEEWVVKKFYLVEVDARFAARKPKRSRRRDEVNLVAARCEFYSKLGRNDSRAAVGGIAGDANSKLTLS